MKKSLYLPALTFTAILGFLLSGCDKVKDAIVKDPLADLKVCNIKSFTITNTYFTRSAICTYNAYGNPVSITFSKVGTSIPNELFKYDSRQRLTDHVQPYDNDTYEQWHKFTYDNNDRIISAANYLNFGRVSTGPQGSPGSNTYFEYDANGRITKTKTVYVGSSSSPLVSSYAYDDNGNRIRPGVTYDNKVNVHRTNKIWMFIDRDYSVNNPVVMQTYNKYGLPTEVGSGAGPYFLQGSLLGSIQYLCDGY
jgi:hypothetical protein